MKELKNEIWLSERMQNDKLKNKMINYNKKINDFTIYKRISVSVNESVDSQIKKWCYW